MTFSATQKPSPPTVFNLQALDWVHCEEETGSHIGISQRTSKLVHFFYKFLNVFILEKDTRISKNSIKFHKEIFQHIYIYIY